MSVLKAIPTNVITGFLGVGKSTAIVHLLKQKPHNERWAVLVNEFGEVGIDGGLIHGNNKAEQGITIREVPGGCMCCTAGLPMQMALNSLLTRAKPQRLLIEPSGLGHPKEVLDTLSSPHYRSVLDMRATVTLVDARKMLDERYTDHQSFNQQLEIADIIVANKADQYQNKDFPALLKYLENKQWLHKHSLYQTQKGQLKHEWLMPASAYEGSNHPPPSSETTENIFTRDSELPPCGYRAISNQGEGFYSQGLMFKPSFIFNRNKLLQILSGINVERVKGIFITEQGIIAYNMADNVLTEYELDEAMDSRIECIASNNKTLNNLEQKILGCLNP